MSTTRANVPTVHGSRYLQQLCKHWSHTFQVIFNPNEGHIDFVSEAGKGSEFYFDLPRVTPG